MLRPDQNLRAQCLANSVKSYEGHDGYVSTNQLISRASEFESHIRGDGEQKDTSDGDAYGVDHDENTMVKVREALESELSGYVLGVDVAQAAINCITALQNAGILFRERKD